MSYPTRKIHELRSRGALFVINDSGGKDSQAMKIYLREILHIPKEQILVIHAHLPEVEWPDTEDHVYKYSRKMGLETVTVQARKTFFEMVRHRKMFPSPQYRQCTSDLKRGPLEKGVRAYLRFHPEFKGLVVNCMGLRAEESASRSRAQVFKFNKRNSKAGREWYDWLPIHDWSTHRVFKTIRIAQQKPHWAYAKGMSRLSCSFCIMSNLADLRTAAKLRPDMYRKYIGLEQEVGHTMMMPRKDEKPRTLEEITGLKIVVAGIK